MDNKQIRKLQSIHDFPELLAYLRDELDWPIEDFEFDELTFDYTPEELGIDEHNAAKILEIKRLRPLNDQQPWGIFFVSLEPKQLPVVALRRLLSKISLKKRASANKADQAAWHHDDILFISNFGEENERQLSFAHFAVNEEKHDLPILKVLGWDNKDTKLHVDAVVEMLKAKLLWPADVSDTEGWRQQWREAFTLRHKQVVSDSKEMAIRLAELARKIRDSIMSVLQVESEKGPLRQIMETFKEALIHDLDETGFADMYAQTIAYGLLSARIADPHGSNTVEHLGDHMRTNPFLKELMETFLDVGGRKRGKTKGAGLDFDELGVSEVVDLLDNANMEAVVRDFGDRNRQEDPVMHFYESFLHEYNKQLKVQRGVFYTPQPVVSYIVRSVHELLQTEFGLEDGLADTTTWGEMLKRHPDMKLPPLTDEPGEKRTISPDEPFVQILDPATGTATFPVEVIEVIYNTMTAKWKQQGKNAKAIDSLWNDYVPQHLLPRLHAYELMMAPYAIAHMKVGLKLAETGYRFESEERARIYLTNALEPWQKQLSLPDFDALAHEAAAVNEIKRLKRFTVVIGNPPYSNFGQLNKNPFILGLLEDYKRGLAERKINLDDDFIKFVRFSQQLLDANHVGVFGMITNNVFIDGITHRRMRESLKTSFADVRILDLHGSSKKLEETPDGKKDENVFDIQQGVGISLFINPIGDCGRKVSHAELWGERASKYDSLAHSAANSTRWKIVESLPPHHFFVPKNFDLAGEYRRAPALSEVFPEQNAGIQTKNDRFVYAMTRSAIEKRIADLRSERADRIAQKYELSLEGHWDIHAAKEDIRKNKGVFVQVLNKPFDKRWTYYTAKSSGFMARPRAPVMRCGLIPNRILLTVRNPRRGNTDSFFVADTIVDKDGVSPFDNATVFPLFLPNAADGQAALLEEKKLNLGQNFLAEFRTKLGLRACQDGLPAGVAPQDIFHYAYAVFNSLGYRSRYAEFLKIDFPRLPLTGNLELFRELARLGGDLTALHLLESTRLKKPITKFIGKNPVVKKVGWTPDDGGTVWLDGKGTAMNFQPGSSGFCPVPEAVWNFHIGGYQVCEKWLKDRGPRKGNPGRTLTDDDIAHYHKIVIALTETIRIMAEIDEVIEAHGGWPGAFVTAEDAPDSAEQTTENYEPAGEALEPESFDKVADSGAHKQN